MSFRSQYQHYIWVAEYHHAVRVVAYQYCCQKEGLDQEVF